MKEIHNSNKLITAIGVSIGSLLYYNYHKHYKGPILEKIRRSVAYSCITMFGLWAIETTYLIYN